MLQLQPSETTGRKEILFLVGSLLQKRFVMMMAEEGDRREDRPTSGVVVTKWKEQGLTQKYIWNVVIINISAIIR